jgi:hypothetical protein
MIVPPLLKTLSTGAEDAGIVFRPFFFNNLDYGFVSYKK